MTNVISRPAMDVIDARLAAAKERLRAAYADELQRRKCVIHIKDPYWQPSQSVHNPARPEITTSDATDASKVPKVPKAPKPGVLICKATKMDGNPCTAKAKAGCDFCGRHIKKT